MNEAIQSRSHPGSPDLWIRSAVCLWLLAIIAISSRVALTRSRTRHDVYPVYHEAGQSWLDGRDLYRNTQFDYRYSPFFAAALAPVSILPLKVASILWRLIGVSVLLGAFCRASRLGIPNSCTAAEIALMFLLLLPLTLGNLNNGQANLLVLGLLILSIVATKRESWMLAASAVTLAGTIKIYPLAFCLPLVLMHPRRLLWRFALCSAVAIALPFALQRADYVRQQYADWLEYLRTENRSGRPISEHYSDLRLLLQVWSVPVSASAFVVLQIVSGALIACGAWIGRLFDWRQQALLGWILSLFCCWMVLFGPATESSTYVLIAPATVWMINGLFRRNATFLDMAWVAAIYGLQVLPEMAAWFGGMKRFHIYTSLLTLSALALAAYLLRPTIFRELATPRFSSGRND